MDMGLVRCCADRHYARIHRTMHSGYRASAHRSRMQSLGGTNIENHFRDLTIMTLSVAEIRNVSIDFLLDR